MWNYIKKLFKKKEVIEDKPKKIKMDFSNVNFKFNIKSICAFEKLIDKSFFEMADEDIFYLLYAIYITNNPDKPIKQSTFFMMLENKEITKWMITQYSLITEMCEQFKNNSDDEKKSTNDEPIKARIMDYASTLIIEYGINPHYVMYEMDIWELSEYFNAIDTKLKKDAINDRFWAYVNVMPHIDTKKCKSPQHLVPFEWEKESIKKKQESELKNNMHAINNMIGKSIFGDKEDKNG
jgi:hypothetical protein